MAANDVTAQSSGLHREGDEAKAEYKSIEQIGEHLVGNIEGRVSWLELLYALNKALPDPKNPPKSVRQSAPLRPQEAAARRRSLRVARHQLGVSAGWTTGSNEMVLTGPRGGARPALRRRPWLAR